MTEAQFPHHCQMAQDEALKGCLEQAIDALAEYVYSADLQRVDDALEIAKETIEIFPNREESKALMILINFFKGDTECSNG